jgi:hypothetical protein
MFHMKVTEGSYLDTYPHNPILDYNLFCDLDRGIKLAKLILIILFLEG